MPKSYPLVPDEQLYELAFDQFSRQYQAKRLVEATRQKPHLKILDVGGNNGKTREFFPDDEVMVVDLYDRIEPGYTKASALALPFGDNSYDVVMCFDVFEHIPAGDRLTFLSEISRVAKLNVLVAAPFNTEHVSESEQQLNDFYKSLNGKVHPWLIEHIDNGVPETSQIEKFLKDAGQQFKIYQSNNIILWNTMQSLVFLADAAKAPERFSNINRFYNQHIDTIGDAVTPSYRRIYFSTKQGKLPLDQSIAAVTNTHDVNGLVSRIAQSIRELIFGSAPQHALKTQAEQLAESDRQITHLTNVIRGMEQSNSWKITKPLRDLNKRIKRL